jgi:hypothetical protein
VLSLPLSYIQFVKYFVNLKNYLKQDPNWRTKIASLSLLTLLSFVRVLKLFLHGFPVSTFNQLDEPPLDAKNCMDFIKNHLDEIHLDE